MKVYDCFNSYDTDCFSENVKFSCHSWILNCISNLHNVKNIVEANSNNLNKRDLTGKYNAANFLLEVFTYHQTTGFKKYPSSRNPKLDFIIMLHHLILNGVNIQSLDYQRRSFTDNLECALISQEKLSWKQKHSFFNPNIISALFNSETLNTYMNELFESNNNSFYLKFRLDLNLPSKTKTAKKIKL